MRMLFIGGTRFVGRAMAEAAVDAGHAVTVLHRGRTDELGIDGVEHLTADRNDDLSVLAGREFDATVDVCAYYPRQVRTLAAALGGRGGHHVFISTMSVYRDEQQYGFDETGPVIRLDDPTTEEVTNETYGGLKVLCEEAAADEYGADGLAVIRPTYVIGPHDYTGRFTWWVRRVAAGGEVIVPGPSEAPMQLIDARDQGAFTVALAERSVGGVFNAISPAMPYGFGDMLADIASSVAPAGTTLTNVDGPWLKAQGENAMTLPLWTEGSAENVMAADTSRSYTSGLTPRPLADTVADTLTWINETDPPRAEGWGITPEHEAELLAKARAEGAAD